jgi:hypothetical protein
MSFSLSASYIPLKYAAQKYGIPEQSLIDKVKSGSIASGRLPDGELLVAEHEIDPSLNIRREDFAHLRGCPISMSEASRKYSTNETVIPQQNFSRWAQAKYIKVLERGWKVLLDEADVAYCAAVYNAKKKAYGELQGVPLFDENGNPYRLKYPEIATKKRQRRRQE